MAKVLKDRFQLLHVIGKGGRGVVYKGLDISNASAVAVKQVSLAGIPKEELKGEGNLFFLLSPHMAKVLKDRFQLLHVIGKGGRGVVYKGLDISNASAVAVKQVSLAGIPKEELKGIMSEIKLLKKLEHPNIVKYVDSVQTDNSLFIVLEFVENGSLADITKEVGRFPEPLIVIYISQILEGLDYLHEQGVIHRDIKGANILSTKDGTVKLADFGVATNTTDDTGHALGSPYWMAPEIIELNGSSTKSDIWSLGCTIVELITGKPPYYDLDQMAALFRIVQDDCPPLPEGISSICKDFLTACFQKEPLLRKSASELLKHRWILTHRKKQQMKKQNEAIQRIEMKDQLMEYAALRQQKEKQIQQKQQLNQQQSKPNPQSPTKKRGRESTGSNNSNSNLSNITNNYRDALMVASKSNSQPNFSSTSAKSSSSSDLNSDAKKEKVVKNNNNNKLELKGELKGNLAPPKRREESSSRRNKKKSHSRKKSTSSSEKISVSKSSDQHQQLVSNYNAAKKRSGSNTPQINDLDRWKERDDESDWDDQDDDRVKLQKKKSTIFHAGPDDDDDEDNEDLDRLSVSHDKKPPLIRFKEDSASDDDWDDVTPRENGTKRAQSKDFDKQTSSAPQAVHSRSNSVSSSSTSASGNKMSKSQGPAHTPSSITTDKVSSKVSFAAPEKKKTSDNTKSEEKDSKKSRNPLRKSSSTSAVVTKKIKSKSSKSTDMTNQPVPSSTRKEPSSVPLEKKVKKKNLASSNSPRIETTQSTQQPSKKIVRHSKGVASLGSSPVGPIKSPHHTRKSKEEVGSDGTPKSSAKSSKDPKLSASKSKRSASTKAKKSTSSSTVAVEKTGSSKKKSTKKSSEIDKLSSASSTPTLPVLPQEIAPSSSPTKSKLKHNKSSSSLRANSSSAPSPSMIAQTHTEKHDNKNIFHNNNGSDQHNNNQQTSREIIEASDSFEEDSWSSSEDNNKNITVQRKNTKKIVELKQQFLSPQSGNNRDVDLSKWAEKEGDEDDFLEDEDDEDDWDEDVKPIKTNNPPAVNKPTLDLKKFAEVEEDDDDDDWDEASIETPHFSALNTMNKPSLKRENTKTKNNAASSTVNLAQWADSDSEGDFKDEGTDDEKSKSPQQTKKDQDVNSISNSTSEVLEMSNQNMDKSMSDSWSEDSDNDDDEISELKDKTKMNDYIMNKSLTSSNSSLSSNDKIDQIKKLEVFSDHAEDDWSDDNDNPNQPTQQDSEGKDIAFDDLVVRLKSKLQLNNSKQQSKSFVDPFQDDFIDEKEDDLDDEDDFDMDFHLHTSLVQEVFESVKNKLSRIVNASSFSSESLLDPDTIIDYCENIIQKLREYKELKEMIVKSEGVIPIIELLELQHQQLNMTQSSDFDSKYLDVLLSILKVVNEITEDQPHIQEGVQMIGGISSIILFWAPIGGGGDLNHQSTGFYPTSIRKETVRFF
eukprot:TRINITY_DN6324_c0_g1_i3.p1 TRINITY_DN6324_c0_g1~~TRINITY_DN6324_c0_g1_i3.p1  ORF type:complete len:1458 (-),score=499.55 TRINITY_DN6324_c0_g1_i3:1446-5765(-)